LAGGVIMGIALGTAAEVVSVVPESVRVGLGLILLVALLMAEFAGLGGRLPQNRRLVPQDIAASAPGLASLQFGLELGSGVRTFVTTALPLALAAGVILVGSLPLAMVAGAGFALGRGAMPLARSASGDTAGWDDRLARQGRVLGALGSAGLICALASEFASATTSAWATAPFRVG
jgi:hypothetical protein